MLCLESTALPPGVQTQGEAAGHPQWWLSFPGEWGDKGIPDTSHLVPTLGLRAPLASRGRDMRDTPGPRQRALLCGCCGVIYALMNLGHFVFLFRFVVRGVEMTIRRGKGPGEKSMALSPCFDRYPIVPGPLVTDPVPPSCFRIQCSAGG